MPRRSFPPLVPEPECLHCGYDLRGLSADGQCPECALAVRVSLTHDRLEGRQLVFVAERVRVLFWVGIGRSVAIMGAAVFTLNIDWLEFTPVALALFLVLSLVRTWAAGTLARDVEARARVKSHGQAARLVLIAETLRCVASAFALVFLLMTAVSRMQDSMAQSAFPLVFFGSVVLDLLSFMAWHRFASTLAMRIGAPLLARGTLMASYIGGVAAVLLAVVFCAGPLIALILHHRHVFQLKRALDSAVSGLPRSQPSSGSLP